MWMGILIGGVLFGEGCYFGGFINQVTGSLQNSEMRHVDVQCTYCKYLRLEYA